MPAPKPVRLVDPFITLGTGAAAKDMTCFCAGIHLTGDTDDDLATFCDPQGFAWTLGLDLKMSLGSQSLDEALTQLGGPGTVVDFEFAYAKGTATATNPHWAGKVRIPPYPIVDAGINEPTSFTMTGDVVGDIARTPPSPNKGAAAPGTTFPAEATVTASDASNAAKLAGLGYVASPTTNWTTGQKITVGTFDFNWSGTAWAAGAHA